MLTLRVVDPAAVTEVGANVAVAPAGRPLTLERDHAREAGSSRDGCGVRGAGACRDCLRGRRGRQTEIGNGDRSRNRWAESPPLSVALNDATYVPGVEYCT